MTTYTIKVHNKSDEKQHFMLFNEKPTVSSNISQVWANVWVKSPVVAHPHGTATFSISSKFYGVCGETGSALGSGVSVSTSDYVDIKITTDSAKGTKVTMDIVDDGPVFNETLSTTSTAGAFAIRTGDFVASKYGTWHGS